MCSTVSPFFICLFSYKLELVGDKGFADDMAKLHKHMRQYSPLHWSGGPGKSLLLTHMLTDIVSLFRQLGTD